MECCGADCPTCDTYDGLVKWHGLNGPGVLDNTIQVPGDIVNIGFQYFTCDPFNNIVELPFFDACVDPDGIVMQAGWYNEQPVEEFATAEELAACALNPPENNPDCEQELLELIGLNIDQEFIIRVSQISGAAGNTNEGGVLGTGVFFEFGSGEVILLQDDVGGFYNLFWDTDDDVGPDLVPNTGDERDLPGPGTYAVDIILTDGVDFSAPLVDDNDGSAYHEEIKFTITDDPFQEELQPYREDLLTSFILTVEGP